MVDWQIYNVFAPLVLIVIAMIAMRVIGHVHGNRLPLFYFASSYSPGLSPDRLRRYESLRSVGLRIGLLTMFAGSGFALAIDAAPDVTTILYCVGLSIALTSAFYLEYCMATGRVSAPISD